MSMLADSFDCTLPRPWAGAGGTGTERAAALLAAVAEEPCIVNSISVSELISPFTSKSALSSKLMGLAEVRCAGGEEQVRHRLYMTTARCTVYRGIGGATTVDSKASHCGQHLQGVS